MSFQERERSTISGILMLAILGVIAGLAVFAFFSAAREGQRAVIFSALAVIALCFFCTKGFFTVAPNQTLVLQLFGKYVGSVKGAGLHWANPFISKHKVSMRVRNFETARLKVNDHDGNPIEIAAVVVWKVIDAAEASFEVDNYENYVHVQSESAVRNLATGYAYDAH